MLTRLATWWLARSERRRSRAYQGPAGECEVCAGLADHTIVAIIDDGVEAEAGGGGGTGMSADYCAAHCPGGCRRGCPTLAA